MGEMVLGLFSASLATVSLPAMSRLADEGNTDGLRVSLAKALRGTALMAIPASVGMAVLAQPIIAVLMRTGRFGADAVTWTAVTLAYQSVGLLFIATSRITAQCLYALKDYRTPAYSALLSMIVNVILSWILMRHLGTGGIALANGLSSFAGLGLMTRSLSGRLPHPPYGAVLKGWLSMGFAAGLMGLGTWWAARSLVHGEFHGTWHTSLRLFPMIAGAASFYFVLLLLLKVPEARELTAMLRRKLFKA
jgi:putative peptidoglycan lipid II flippase